MSGNSEELFLLPKRIVNRIGRPFGINPFPRAFDNKISENNNSAIEVFDNIFLKNYWGSAESRSGVGSEVTFAARYRDRLKSLIVRHGFKKIFDAPCGDLNWMSTLVDQLDIEYVGGDVSPQVIADARSRCPDLDLGVFDITSDKFPDADVWHCRDCLFHLPFSSIRRALENFSESSIAYALITSHRAYLLHRNLDVGIGGFRFLDLQRAPISLPAPLVRIPDFAVGRDFPRYVCLWSRQQIAAALKGMAV